MRRWRPHRRSYAVSIPGEANTLPAETTRDAARDAGIAATAAPIGGRSPGRNRRARTRRPAC